MYDPPGYVPFWKRLPAGTGNPEWSADPSYDVFSRVYRDDFYWGFKPVHHLTDDDRKYVAGRYDAGVYYTDLFVGELLKLLDELKLAERTLVILQSMHGDDLGEHGLYFHYDITEPVIKNALIMRFPGMQSVGRRVAEQVQGLDVLPTVLDFLDIPVPADARGKSLVPLARDERGATGTEYVFIDRLPWWEYVLSNWYLEFQSGNAGQFAPEEEAELERYRQQLTASFSRLASPPGDIAVRTNRWKLILRKHPVLLEQVSWWRFITGKGEKLDEVVLYDLVKDPGESRNVAKSYPAVTSALKERLLAWDREIEQQRPVYTREKRQIIPYP
jgi:arylsulfatase A-like enzyme